MWERFKIFWNISQYLPRKMVIWMGAFLMGCAPAIALTKSFPNPFDLSAFATALHSAGVLREFQFAAVCSAGVAVLNVLDHLINGEHHVTKYGGTYTFVLAICVGSVFLIFLILSDGANSPRANLLQPDIDRLVDYVESAVWAALALEALLATIVIRAKIPGFHKKILIATGGDKNGVP